MSKDQIDAAMRHVYTAVGALVACAVAIGLLGSADAEKIVRAVNDIGGSVAVIVGALAGLLPIINGARAAWTASHSQQLKKVEEMPGVSIVVNPVAAPQVAIDAAKDPERPKVLEALRSLFAAAAVSLLFLTAGGSLVACASGGTDTRTAAERAIETVDKAYTVATAAAAIYVMLPDCTKTRPGVLCSQAVVVDQIGKARAVLDLAIGRARQTIAAAKDADGVSLGIRIALDAVAVYTAALASFGVSD